MNIYMKRPIACKCFSHVEEAARLRQRIDYPGYHIRARKLLNLFMEMNCGGTFVHLSGLNLISTVEEKVV
jgi:hypothetical protein